MNEFEFIQSISKALQCTVALLFYFTFWSCLIMAKITMHLKHLVEINNAGKRPNEDFKWNRRIKVDGFYRLAFLNLLVLKEIRRDYVFSNGIESVLCAVHYVNKIRDLTFNRWVEFSTLDCIWNIVSFPSHPCKWQFQCERHCQLSLREDWAAAMRFSVFHFLCLRIKILTFSTS